MQNQHSNNNITNDLQHLIDGCKGHPNHEAHLAFRALNKIQDQQITIASLILLSGFLCICLLWSVIGG
jgi:hypothetical protein